MRSLQLCLLALLLLLAAPAVLCQSQLGTGSISGTVVDSNGAAVVGATVKATNVDTGIVREVTTNSDGLFNVPVLPTGKYNVTVEQSGFSKLVQSDLDVTVGAAVTLKLSLKAGGAQETINITAQPEIDTTKTEESALVDRNQISELPINGRRYDQFALLTPGVSRDGRFGLLSYHGQSGVFNNFTIEGNDDTQALFSEARGRTRIASSISSNAIQEFQVEQSSFLPEYGRSAGGGVNTTIRSGGNQIHGDGFYYFRNKAFDARDPLAPINPSELRQQFGGSVSGPIKKDKVFFFVNYDQQLRNSPLVVTDTGGAFNQPKQGATESLANYQIDLNNFQTGCNDVVKRLQSFAGIALNPGFRCDATIANPVPSSQFIGTEARQFNQNLFLTKTDINIDQRNVLTVTYNYLNARNPEGIQTGLTLNNVGGNGFDGVKIHSLNVRLTSTLDATKVNEMRFQWGRDFEFETGDQPGPNISIGSFSLGQATFLQRAAFPDERRLQYVDNFSYIVGKHTFKFGGEVNRVRDVINNPAFFAGAYTFADTVTYGKQLNTTINAPTDNLYTTFRQNLGLPGLTFSTTDYAAFAQDSFKATRKLTINYGLRYDYEQLPRPKFPNPDLPLTTSFNTDRNDWGPRVGVAYDLTGSGKTVLRGGYGLYYGRTSNGILEDALLQTGFTDPTKSTIAITSKPTDKSPLPTPPTFPNLLSTSAIVGGTGSSPFFIAADFKRPRLQEANVGVQRDLGHNMILNASFVYDKGDHLPLNFDANLPTPSAANLWTRNFLLPDGTPFSTQFLAFPGTGTPVRPNTKFGAITLVDSVGETWYKGMLIELRRRFSNNLQFGISYTLSKAENDYGNGDGGGTGAEGPFGGGTVLNQFAPLDAFKSVAPTDQRHRFVFNGIYTANFKTGSDAFNSIVNGFELSGIFTAESGRPYTTVVAGTVPAISISGSSFNGFGGLFGQGTAGSLVTAFPRNSNVGDANYKLDLRVTRNVKLSERFNVQLIVEGFNVFNHSNFNSFNNTIATFTGFTTVAGTGNLANQVAPTIQLQPGTFQSAFALPNGDAAPPDGTNARRVQVSARFRF